MTADLQHRNATRSELRRTTRAAVGAAIRTAYTGLYTQTELARRIGVAQNTLSRWTTGEVEPSLSDLIAIEDACELPRGHILRSAGLVEEIGTPEQAIVGLGGHIFMRKNSQDAVREFRPYFDVAPVYGNGPSLEDFADQTPLTVGSPQQVIEKTLAFREYAGDYQRQLFLIDHAGLPLKTVLEQLDMLGEEVVPVLREEFAKGRPADVPDAPTHGSLLAAAGNRGAGRRDAENKDAENKDAENKGAEKKESVS